MALLNTLSNMGFWILLGVVFALLIGPIGDISSTLIVIVLIIQMTFSMDGLTFRKGVLKENKKSILISFFACFGISMVSALLVGSLFISDYPEIWKGWVMLAAVPCAVSVVTMSFFVKGNTTMCVMSLAVIYIAALILTPLITRAIIGESVSVLKIFSYVILFVIVPILASFPLKKVQIDRTRRVILLNIMIFLMVLFALGQNRDYIFSEPIVIVLVALASVLRIFVVGMVVLHLLKKHNHRRDNSMVYLPMAVWKNSGLAATLCFVILGSTTEAAVPCVISLLIELLWFAFISDYIEKTWPEGTNDALPTNG